MKKIKTFDHYKDGEKLYIKMVMPLCDKYKITYMEFTVIMFLANHPEYDTASEIVIKRHLTKSHVSISLKSLLEKKFLTEFYKGNNNKTKHIKITENASKIIADGRQIQKDFKNILSEGFTAEEKLLWENMMVRIDQNINKYLSK